MLRTAVNRRMHNTMNGTKSGAYEDPYAVPIDMQRGVPRPSKHPYHPFWNPLPPPDPEWAAGHDEDEMLFSIFVHHTSANRSLWDNPLFITQAFELLTTLVFGFIALLVVTDWIAINNYVFTIALSVVWVVMVMVHFLSIWYWAKQPRFSHKHNNEIQFPFFFWGVGYGLAIVLLGSWLRTIPGSCCSFADSQPDPLDYSSELQFHISYAYLFIISVFLIYPTVRALISHYYPEGRWVPTLDSDRNTDIYIDEIDDAREIKALVPAPSHAHGKAHIENPVPGRAPPAPRGVRRNGNENDDSLNGIGATRTHGRTR